MRKTGNSVPLRVHPDMKKLLDDVRIERLKCGKDRKPLSNKRLSLAVTRIPSLKDSLIKGDIKDG